MHIVRSLPLDIRADVEWHEGQPRFDVSRIEDANAKTSFFYLTDGVEHAQHRARADHDNMERELARLAPKGVLLGLRDNGGGNNPNWFMDWFANGSYVDRFVLTKLAPDLDTADKLREAGVSHVAEYLAAFATRTPDQVFTKPRPFFLSSGWL